jgi:hypothetical protein
MPIKGLSDIRRIRRGGYIRLGEMKVAQSGKEYPSAIDHFKPEFEDKKHEALFHQIYGDEPKRIRVAFGHDDTDKVFPQWFKLYGQSGLKCKGDNETAGRYRDGEIVEVECIGPEECPFSIENGYKGKPGCKRMASLQFFIHGIPELAVFQINTTSYNSIVNVNTQLEMLARLTNGHIAGVWVDLVLEPQQVQAEGKAKTVHVLNIVIPVGLHNIKALECAFTAPLELPAPSDAKDAYLTPENGFASDADPAEFEQPVQAAPDAQQRGRADRTRSTAKPVKAEVVDDREPDAAPVSGDLADDPDVARAFDEAECPDVKRAALLKSARDGRWSKETLLGAIFKGSKHAPAAKPSTNVGNGTAAAKPATTSAAPKPANGTNGGTKPAATQTAGTPGGAHYAKATAPAAPATTEADPLDYVDF